MKKTPAERFWSKVDKHGPVPEHRPDLGNCWVWLAGKSRAGYGHFGYGGAGKNVRAHRWSFMAANGPIAPGLQLDHLCRNPSCVNPSHLEPVTSRENTMRGTGIAASYTARTHCAQGHEFIPENTYRSTRRPNTRQCRTCRRRVGREIYRRKQERRNREATPQP